MEWVGGIDFLRMIVQSLLIAQPDLELHIILPDRDFGSFLRQVKGRLRRFVRNTILRQDVSVLVYGTAEPILRSALGEFESRVKFHHAGRSKGSLLSLGRKLGLDVIAPSFLPLGSDFPIPWLGYLYDFQHRRLPDYFTEEDRRRRDREFDEMLRQAAGVIVNSIAVAKDAAEFHPAAQARIFSLPLSTAPETIWLNDLPGVTEKYHIRAPFFMISNQFFIHKRHNVAFEAFHQFARNHANVSLVCTGHTSDPRQPQYFSSLLDQLDRLGIRDRVKILGLIPKRDQIELMKNALAVIQPTAFEGGPGGGSVCDAISLGIPSIVSDIPVNLETPNVWRFFPADDAAALSEAMSEIAAKPHTRVDMAELLTQGLERRRKCGGALLAAIDFVISRKKLQ